MTQQMHTHQESGETHTHDTDTDTAGHTHETDAGVAQDTGTAAVVGPGPGTVMGRIVLTVLGAAAMIVGAFMEWVGGEAATQLSYRVFFQPNPDADTVFITSAGAVIIAIAILALLGLSANWLTRFAGALGIAAFVLFAISVYRAETSSAFLESIQIGAWLTLAGSVIALIGGFIGTRRVVTLP